MNIGPCGIACTVCRYYSRGLCEGCVRGDLCPPVKALLSSCPILRCAAAGKIPYCARDCPNFPCALFEGRFPRCWSQMGVNHHQAALLNNKTRTWSPILASTLEVKKPDRDRLRVFCLGPFRVCRGLTEIQDWEWGQGKGPTQKIKTMFAYLLSRKERGTRKETLINLLWPEQSDPDRASAVFHVTLHCLRRVLEPELNSMTNSSHIKYEHVRYCFKPLQPYWLDADAFESHCRRAEECERYGDLEAAILYWDMAVDVYGGDYMAGIQSDYTENRDYDWCMTIRQHLRELYLKALLAISHYYHNNGEYDLCLKYARLVLGVEPCFEAVHRLVMGCLIKCGQLDRARHQYRVCEAELARCEDRLPSERTRLLYDELI